MEINQYYVTFGVKYTRDPERGVQHPLGMHADGYAVIEAPDLETAQRIADAVFDQQYAFIYDKENFIDDGTKDRWYSEPDSLLLTIAWAVPVPATTHDSRCTLGTYHEGECNWKEFRG